MAKKVKLAPSGDNPANPPKSAQAKAQDDQVMAVRPPFAPPYPLILYPPRLLTHPQPQPQHSHTNPSVQTNNSSIVSKRSVEKLYYADEPHFFRYFVKKFQRRAPLINRGYWLRLRAIDVLVRDFLKAARGRGKRGVVVNLGCGRFVLCLSFLPFSFFFFFLLFSPFSVFLSPLL